MKIKSDTEASARRWEVLAEQERKRKELDARYGSTAAHDARIKLYENAAKALRLGDVTGVAHCACHLIPMEECARRSTCRR
jgi:hypothetical protein